jgi:hypothetical protein
MRASTVTFTTIGMCVGVILFRLKYEVLALENTHHHIKKSIQETRESIHVLKAEWAHLTDPSRIQKLSVKYLNNGEPLSQKKILSVSQKTTATAEILKTESKEQKKAPLETPLKDSMDELFDEPSKPIEAKNVSFKKGDTR